MRIRQIIGIQTLVICIGLLILGATIGGTWRDLQDQQQAITADTVAMQDLRIMEETVKSWFINNDLIFGSNQTYLIDGAIRQAANIIDLTNAIEQSHQVRVSEERLIKLTILFRLSSKLLEERKQLSVKSDGYESYELLSSWDKLSTRIIQEMEAVRESLHASIAGNKGNFENKYKNFVYHLVLGHVIVIILILGMWNWVVRTLVRPLTTLTGAADYSLEQGVPLDAHETGPEEVRYLSKSISEFVRSLEQRVAARTAQLEAQKHQLQREVRLRLDAERVAIEAADRALEASEAKSKFLANMSHEIRTPLNGVLGTAELLSAENLSEEVRVGLQTIRTSGRHLLELINSVLDFSKMEVDGIELRMADFQLDELLRDIRSIFVSNTSSSDVSLIFDIDPKIPVSLCGDRVRIKQILTNLLGNAFKFTQEGTVTLFSRLESQDGSCINLLWEVRDTGIGIPEDRWEEIFDPFRQVEEGSTRRYGGTGLGLSISRQLAVQMNGGIEIRSVVGEGTVFRCTMQVQAAENEEIIPVPPAGGTALVVTNDSVLADQLFASLASSQWNVEVVDGQDFRKKLESGTSSCMYLAVIADLDNAELVMNTLAKREARPNCLVVTDQFSVVRRLDVLHRFDAVVPKPIIAHELLRKLGGVVVSETEGNYTGIKNSLQGLRILVAEDNLVNQKVATGMLKLLGVDVSVANNGAEAIEEFIRSSYDLILMDWQMPVLDGIQAARKIRKLEKQHNSTQLPIIALTANSDETNVKACISAGMNDFLAKPYTLENLHNKIKGNLGSHANVPVDQESQDITAL